MALLSVSHLTFRYDGSDEPLFSDVSLQLDTSWRLGFVGRNGRGKTTFLRLLTGELTGRGTISSPTAFEYFPYAVPDETQATAAVLAGICPEAPDWALERELRLLDLSTELLGRPWATLSGGERTKALIAAMCLRENAFLLIDEPTNHLDAAGREKVSRYLAGKAGFILVSHDRAFLDGCVDHILALNRAGIELEAGNYSSWAYNRALRDQHELDTDEKLRRDIRRLQASARSAATWADRAESRKIGLVPGKTEKSIGRRSWEGEKSRKMQQRRKNLQRRTERAIEEKAGLLQNLERTEELKLSPLRHYAERLIEARDLTLSYDGRAVCTVPRFELCQGQRIRLSGRNGCGKSSLLKLLTGTPIDHTGEIRTAPGLIFSVVPQDTSFLSGSLDAFIERAGVDGTQMRTILRKLDFDRALFDRDMGTYSAGQKKKVLLARSLSERAHVYVWDEPLNYVDLFSREQLERLILDFAPTMLLVEHDAAFADAVATDTLNLG